MHTGGKGANAAIDPIGGKMTGQLVKSLAQGGKYMLYSALALGEPCQVLLVFHLHPALCLLGLVDIGPRMAVHRGTLLISHRNNAPLACPAPLLRHNIYMNLRPAEGSCML